MRSTALAVVDQALMSALNLLLALLLIRYAGKDDYGLYSQLLTTQSLVSPLHTGIFISAVLALAVRKHGDARTGYRAGMARAEIATSIVSALLVAVLLHEISRAIDAALSWSLCVAAAVSILGLWWREFVRQLCFAALRPGRALFIDVAYALLVAGSVGLAILETRVSAASILWATGIAGIVVSVAPMLTAALGAQTSLPAIFASVRESWSIGRWDALGSIVTWGYAQSYVYFAALIAGAGGAAEIAAARLLASPLSLLWAAYANVLRPTMSRALDANDQATARALVMRSFAFVLASATAYGLALSASISWLQQLFFKDQFRELSLLAALWTVYYTLTGVSTVASSVLRSALQFSGVFWRQAATSVAAIVLLAASVAIGELAVLVFVLVLIETVGMVLMLHGLSRLLGASTRVAASCS